MACSGGHLAIVNLLIEKNKNVLNDVQTALMNACKNQKKHSSIEVVKILIKHNAVSLIALKLQDENGYTCLMSACSIGNIDVICR